MQKSVIKNFRGAGGGFGIHFTPTGASNLFVSETAMTDNSKAAGTAGILVRPISTGSANAVLNQISVENNNNGISVDDSASTAPVIEVLIRDSVSATNGGVGIAANAASGSAITRVMIDRSTTSHNVTGVLAQGSSIVLIGGTSVFGNQTGLSAVPGAQIFSYQTNQNNGNFVDNGAPTAVLSRQ